MFPPKWVFYFLIEFMHELAPISRDPYQTNTSYLHELKDFLNEILKKGFICSSVLSWDAPTIFMKKKDKTLFQVVLIMYMFNK